jgi:ABC-type Zn uptake system ZnuABC Zn-binding protein ZnuA
MSENASRIRVVVTSLPLLWVVKEVGGNLVSVVDIVPPGTDPHTYEPPPSQLVSMLKNADVVFITGPTHLPVELRIRELAKERAIKAIIVDYEDYVRHGLKVLPNPRTGLPNPHGYLFSLTGLCAVVRTASDVLSAINPAHATYFKARADALVQDLMSELSALRETVPHGLRVGLAGPPLQYVAEELGLNVTFMLLPDVESEPSENDVTALINAVKTREVDAFLISDMIAAKNPRLVVLARRLGIPVILVPITKLSSTPQAIPPALTWELRSSIQLGSSESEGCLSSSGNNGWELLHEFAVWLAACEAVLILVLVAVLSRYRRVIMDATLK